MQFTEQVKMMTREQVARMMVEMVTHVSPETFMKLAILASQLIRGDMAASAVEAVKESLLEGKDSQASRMFKRVMTELIFNLIPVSFIIIPLFIVF